MIFRSFLTRGTKTKAFDGTINSFAYLRSNLRFKRKVLLVIGIPTTLLFIRLVTVPSCVRSEWILSMQNENMWSIDKENSIDVNKVAKTVVYSGFFSIDRSLDSSASRRLLTQLLNPNNYNEGEWGTPEYSKTIYYQDVNGNVIGKTLFDYIGQTRTWPSTERQTRLGELSKKGLEEILELIE